MSQMSRKEEATIIVGYGNVYQKYMDSKTLETVETLTNMAQQAYIAGAPESESNIIKIQEIQEKYYKKQQEKADLNVRKLRIENGTERLAGYINASILIYFILIFGVLIALSLIIFQF